MMFRWVRVVPTGNLIEGEGAGGLVKGACVAIFRLPDDRFAVVGSIDPRSGANVMAHGLTGSVEIDGEDVAFVASPLDKHRYRLDTGDALDGDAPGLGCWPFRIVDDIVEVAPLLADPPTPSGIRADRSPVATSRLFGPRLAPRSAHGARLVGPPHQDSSG